MFIWACFLLKVVISDQWLIFVQDGSDDQECGRNISKPCSSLNEVLHHIMNGDIINIDARGTEKQPLLLCSDAPLQVSFTMVGFNGRPIIYCNKSKQNAIILNLIPPEANFIEPTRKK